MNSKVDTESKMLTILNREKLRREGIGVVGGMVMIIIMAGM